MGLTEVRPSWCDVVDIVAPDDGVHKTYEAADGYPDCVRDDADLPPSVVEDCGDKDQDEGDEIEDGEEWIREPSDSHDSPVASSGGSATVSNILQAINPRNLLPGGAARMQDLRSCKTEL